MQSGGCPALCFGTQVLSLLFVFIKKGSKNQDIPKAFAGKFWGYSLRFEVASQPDGVTGQPPAHFLSF